MFSENLLLMWLAYSAAAAALFLAAGAVAVLLRRQPVERLRIIQWTLFACLLAPLANRLPGVPRWSLAVATSVSQPIQPETNALPDAGQPKTTAIAETPARIGSREIDRNEIRSNEPTRGVQAGVNRPFNAPIAPSSSSASSPSPPAGEGWGEGAAANAGGASKAWSWPRIVLTIYAIGVGLMLVWYAIGYCMLSWLNWTAQTVPDEVAELFRSLIGNPAAWRVRLCVHPRVELPLAYGLLRPTILLPEQMCTAVSSPSPLAGEGRGERAATPALRYSLLHEWSHLARGDVWRWRLSTIVGMFLFYQPLFWWLRRQQRLCQDFLADSQAATASTPSALADPTTSPSSPSPSTGEGRGEGVSISTAREDYAQFLVNLAHRRLGLPGALALSIGDGRSNLYRRVQMLLENRHPLAQHLHWTRRFAIAGTAMAVIAVTSAIRLTAEDAKPAGSPTAQATASEPKPATDVTKPRAANAAPQPATNATTKADEKASSNAAKPDEFTYTGTVEEKDPATLIESLSSEERRGNRPAIQQNRSPGKPITGARVHLQFFDVDESIPRKRTPGKEIDLVSDANGKFTFTAPADKVNQGRLGFTIEATHPGFISRSQPGFPNMLRPPDAPAPDYVPLLRPLEVAMLPAKAISGVVVSPDGKPVAGAGLAAFSRPSAWQTGYCYEAGKTDEHGHFELPMTATGDGVLWVRPEKDFVPMRIAVDRKRGDLGTIKLEPGITLKGHLLTADAQPRAGVDVWAKNWDKKPENSVDGGLHTYQIAKTNDQGVFVFAPLPPGEYTVGLAATSEQQELRSRYVPQTVMLAADKEPEPVEMRERFNPDNTVPIIGHIEISKQMLEDIARMRALARISQRFGGFGGQPAAEPSTEVESSEKVLEFFAPAIHGTNNGVNASAKGEINAEGDFTIHAPRGLQQAVIELAGTRMLGLTQPGTSVRSQGNANDEESRYFQPQWRLEKDKPWTAGTEIVVGDVGSGSGGIEVKYPETDKLHQFTATGRVQDESTGQPIAGAKVVASVNSYGKPMQLDEFDTDATGKFTVAIPIDAILRRISDRPAGMPGFAASVGLALDVKHADFASPRGQGAMLRITISPVPRLEVMSNSGGPGTQLTPIYMRPGQEVTGTLQTPDGKPATGVTVLASTLTPIGGRLRNARSFAAVDAEGDKQHYGWEKQITDEVGRFKFVLPTEGDATLAIWPAKVYAPIIKDIHDQRGDLGVIKLETGDAIKGRVVDAENKPLAGIYVNAEPVGSEDNLQPAWRRRRSIDHINRAAVTDENGNFELAPLGPGEYRVEPLDSVIDLTTEGLREAPIERHPLPDLFVPQRLTLVAAKQPAPILFRPPTTVNIDGQVKLKRPNASVSSTTNPFARYKPRIVAELNGLPFAVDTSIDSEGNFTAKVPRGATDVQVQLANSQGPQVRAGNDKPLVDPGAISLGTVNEDVHGVEIVYP